MCSELTPRARIPDTRIPQLMQPCLERSRFWDKHFKKVLSFCLPDKINNLIHQTLSPFSCPKAQKYIIWPIIVAMCLELICCHLMINSMDFSPLRDRDIFSFSFSTSRIFKRLKQNMHSLLCLIWLWINWPKVFLHILNQIDSECMLKCEILKGKIYAGRAVQSVQSTTGLNLFMEDYYSWYCRVFGFAHKQLRSP